MRWSCQVSGVKDTKGAGPRLLDIKPPISGAVFRALYKQAFNPLLGFQAAVEAQINSIKNRQLMRGMCNTPIDRDRTINLSAIF